MILEPRSTLSRIKPYVPGKSIEELTAEKGIADAVKLSSNENPLGPSDKAKAAIVAAAGDVNIYPDGSGSRLKAALSERLSVSSDQLILGCGSDEIIRLLAEAYLEPGGAAAFADVSFSQYAFVARIMAADEIVVPTKNGVHDLAGFAEAVARHRPALCFVCNPNNPTGTYVSQDEVVHFLDTVPEETLVVFDEAYFEYVEADDFPDTVDLIRRGRQAVVLRTFSKIYGLAGLRVGYGIAPARIVEQLEKVRPPFNVNRIALAAAEAALCDRDHLETSRRMNAAERKRLTDRLHELGLSVLPSQANFLFVEVGPSGPEIYEALMNRGVIVRHGTSFGRPDAIRVTVGTKEQNDRVLQAFGEILTVAPKGEI